MLHHFGICLSDILLNLSRSLKCSVKKNITRLCHVETSNSYSFSANMWRYISTHINQPSFLGYRKDLAQSTLPPLGLSQGAAKHPSGAGWSLGSWRCMRIEPYGTIWNILEATMNNVNTHLQRSSGWWFGCHFIFSHILGIIIPIDVHIFQRGSNHQPVMFQIDCWGEGSEFPRVKCESFATAETRQSASWFLVRYQVSSTKQGHLTGILPVQLTQNHIFPIPK